MRQEESDKLLAAINEFGKEDPSIAEIRSGLLAKFIDIAAKDSGYTGNAKELLLNYVHLLFLKARAEASKGDNLELHNAMRSNFADEWWKAALKKKSAHWRKWMCGRL